MLNKERAVIHATFSKELAGGYMTKTYFLSMYLPLDQDSSRMENIDDDLLHQLSQELSSKGVTLKQYSDATEMQDSSSDELAELFSYGYYDKLTKERGSVLSVGPVRWLAPWKAEVDVSWYFGKLSGAWGTATVAFGLNGWKVVDFQIKALS